MPGDPKPPAPTAAVGAVSIRFTDAEALVRCAGCARPAMTRAPESESCGHCSRPLRDGAPCSREEFLASRADDAVLPPRPARPALPRREVVDARGRTVAWDRGVRPDHGGAGFGASMEPDAHTHPEALAVVYGGLTVPCPWCEGHLVEVDGDWLARCDLDPAHAVEFMPWPG